MRYCEICGHEVGESVICPFCGSRLGNAGPDYHDPGTRREQFYRATSYGAFGPLPYLPDRIARQTGDVLTYAVVGKGTNSVVYRIDGTRGTFALKVIESPKGSKKQAAALQEVEMLTLLRGDPAAVQMIEQVEMINETESVVYILENYYVSLAHYVNSRDCSLLDCFTIVQNICEAESSILKHGIIHLDIQPKNIFVEPDLKVRLGDFSSSLYLKDLSANRDLRGTLAYMAPEGYREKQYSERSEVYSIGLVLYWLLNDQKLPFMDTDDKELAVYKRLAGTELPEVKISHLIVPSEGRGFGDYIEGSTPASLTHFINSACSFNAGDRIEDVYELRTIVDMIQSSFEHVLDRYNNIGSQSMISGRSSSDDEALQKKPGRAAMPGSTGKTNKPGLLKSFKSLFSNRDSSSGDIENTVDLFDSVRAGASINTTPPPIPDLPESIGKSYAAQPDITGPSFSPRGSYFGGSEESGYSGPLYAPEPEEPYNSRSLYGPYNSSGDIEESGYSRSILEAPDTDEPVDIFDTASLFEDTVPLTGSVAPGQGSGNRGYTPAASDRIIKRVNFSAVAPKTIEKGDYAIIDITMYEDAFREVVESIIEQADGPVKEKLGSANIHNNSTIRIVLTSPDVEVEDGEIEQLWLGDYLVFSYAVMIPEDYAKKKILFKAVVYEDDIIRTRLIFDVKCDAPADQQVAVHRKDIMSAFMSYASEDRSRVATIIQGIRLVYPDLDIFFDIDSLRSGENWEHRLYSEIERRDLLFLCWSNYAKKSKWVEREWRYALENKGIDFIEPVPIERPDQCPPPAELSEKHFSDKLLYIIGAK